VLPLCLVAGRLHSQLGVVQAASSAALLTRGTPCWVVAGNRVSK